MRSPNDKDDDGKLYPTGTCASVLMRYRRYAKNDSSFMQGFSKSEQNLLWISDSGGQKILHRNSI